MFSWVFVGIAASTAYAVSTAHSSWEPPPQRTLGTPGTNASYDYVVIGGGTASLTIASRLSEDPRLRVAVVEQGGFYELDNGNLSTVPAYCTAFAGTDPNDTNPLIDWSFVTSPQAGVSNRRQHYAQGKTLGGSSARNFMVYHRPTEGSLQQWASAVGNDAYTFPRLLKFYKRSPHYNPPSSALPNSTNEQDPEAFDANGGPLEVSFGAYVSIFGSWAQYGFKALGHRLIQGFQSGALLGTSYAPFTVDPVSAERSSSESSFLQAAVRSTRIKVYNNTRAERILFDNNRVATSVVVSSNGSPSYVLTAKREIILSAGVFRSPQLLMVSGIGDRDQLEARGIATIQHLPGVGQNLWDHVFFATLYPVNLATNSAGLNSPNVQAAAISSYNHRRTGPLTIPAPGPLGWEKLPEAYRGNLSARTRQALETSFAADWPELEFLPVDGTLGYQRNYLKEDPRDGRNYASISTALVAPLSRGNVTINSASMADLPIINPNWLTDPADVELAIAAFRRQRDFWRELSNVTIGPEKIPGAAVQTDAQILDFIRKALAPVWHAAGTCKMGRISDRMAVVDSSHRVFGVRSLRIVDASVFPLLPPGHPQATVYALAEKLATELLLQNRLLPVSTTAPSRISSEALE